MRSKVVAAAIAVVAAVVAGGSAAQARPISPSTHHVSRTFVCENAPPAQSGCHVWKPKRTWHPATARR